jgi:hypothetical protein
LSAASGAVQDASALSIRQCVPADALGQGPEVQAARAAVRGELGVSTIMHEQLIGTWSLRSFHFSTLDGETSPVSSRTKLELDRDRRP